MPLSYNVPPGAPNCNTCGYDVYECNCCPYGYHIDLDFVRYCESVGKTVERTASIKRRKDRRRQRQSMDVLLGLIPPLPHNIEHERDSGPSNVIPRKIDVSKCVLIEDTTLNDAVSDFERTLQRSKNTLSNNLPDVTAVSENIRRVPSISSMSSTSSVTVLPEDGATARDFDAVSIESSGLSPVALQNIREQMAVSLKRMKQLEEQVKSIPTLEIQISKLKAEKEQLLRKFQDEENARLNNINNINNNNNLFLRLRSKSFTYLDGLSGIEPKVAPPVPRRRDFGVSCCVITRNVGVGHQTPNTKTISTMTTDDTEKSNGTGGKEKGTQTISSRNDVQTQTVNKSDLDLQRIAFTQTLIAEKECKSVGVSASPSTLSAFTQVNVDTKTIGVSKDKIDDICIKCNVHKISVGVSTDVVNNQTGVISLACLTAPKVSIEKEAPTTRTIGCQYESCNRHKACQHEIKWQTKSCQHELKLAHKCVQYESDSVSKHTDTIGLYEIAHTACNTDEVSDTVDVGCNTTDLMVCSKCSGKEKDDVKKEDSPLMSRIPRLNTSTEKRKFERQITYTKIPGPSSPGLSALDLSPKATPEDSIGPFEKLKDGYTRLEDSVQNGLGSKNSSTFAENTIYDPAERKKAVPSKEMQAAMKVLNDSLQKGQTKNIENQLRNAINIILQEWFKISSLITADPLDVEDYLDCFEETSSALLEYIVNMVDASGNTAMHYAVSHGNFDVVSILLDSKVCDINKQNKAGYTSVMLVSLAEVHSQTHANVVKRLFSLADVNIRAKQHGQTALMLAVSHGRLDMVMMLLEAGADINIQDEDGSTAVMCAAEHGHVNIVKYFLSQPDCDSTISDVDGSTALKIAMEAGHRHIGVLLYTHERNLHGPAKHKRNKSASASPKTPSSPLPIRNISRALPSNK